MKKKTEIKHDIMFVSRDPLIQQGIDIKDFNIEKELPKLIDKITATPVYVLWADGKIEVNKTGGVDVIACLWYEGKDETIKGWSR